MSQYTLAPISPSNTQSPALSPPQDTNPPAPNVFIPSDPPDSQPSKRMYDIAWICSEALESSMENPGEAAEERAQMCIVITGLKECRDVKQVETNDPNPDPRRPKLSDHSVAQGHGIPQPRRYSITVKVRYGRRWADYEAHYDPRYSKFSCFTRTKLTETYGPKTNKKVNRQLLKRQPRMWFRDTLDDNGKRFLDLTLRGLGDHEQDEYCFVCKRRTVIGESTLGERRELSYGEVRRLCSRN